MQNEKGGKNEVEKKIGSGVLRFSSDFFSDDAS